MKKFFIGMLVAVLVLSTFFMAGTAAAKDSEIMEFSSMVGVPRPYTGATNAIRGVPGGGRPWAISAAEGELKANGKLEVEVRGLVIDPNEPVATAGTNPSPTFRVIVSCMSTDATGAAVVSNVMTDPFPADAAGNAEVETKLTLPSPCIAPIIFVTSATGSWFAATGN